jgi:hypothetical protein
VYNDAGERMPVRRLKNLMQDELDPCFPYTASRHVKELFESFRNSIPEQKIISAVKTLMAADLKNASLHPPKFIVDKMLPCGLCVLAAPPKTGKSWLCLALADAIAMGQTFFGNKTDKGTVLYLALEDSEYRRKERLQKIESSMPENLCIMIKDVPRLDEGLDTLIREFADDHPDTRCVIIDTVARVKTGASKGLNSYESDTRQYSVLQELALEKNLAIVAVTHFSKLKQYSNTDDPFERITGSTGLFAVSDACWLIYGKRGADEMTLNVTGRDVFYSESKIKFDSEKCRWIMLGESGELEEQRRIDEYNSHPAVRTIRQLVEESGGRWTGSADLLDEEIMKRTETVPPVGKELKELLYGYHDLFLQRDHIALTKASGGRAGRDYTFERTKQAQLPLE